VITRTVPRTRGRVSGSGISLWHKQEIQFDVDGEYDLTQGVARVLKAHRGKYTNKIEYTLKLDATCLTLTSTEPNLMLRRVPGGANGPRAEGAPPAVVDDSNLCKVCMEREINSVLLPCSHFVCCTACGHQLRSCPICRASISETRLIYRA